ncbi:MAG TPA: HAD family hydrolase, partial [Candidatus Dormibacteraeota bacterium]|nr:HAD family hydrolase [Candidatus Dormibacteraeota bacterium]
FDAVAPGRTADLLAAYHVREPEVEAEHPVRLYRDVLAESFRRAASDCGLAALHDRDAGALALSLPGWPVFPDVGPALAALRDAGWRLALLTNCDDALVAQTRTRIPVQIDDVVTAESTRSYKPGHAHWERFGALHPDPARWVHIAQSRFHDIVPAGALGLPCIWIDRLGEGGELAGAGPTATLPDLRDLPATIERVAPPRP